MASTGHAEQLHRRRAGRRRRRDGSDPEPGHRRGARARAGLERPRTSIARCGRPARAFDGWSNTTPAQRSQALLAIADLIEEHGEEIARLEALNAGKPIEAVRGDELPVMADNLRFFAGAARCLEGRAAGEYMEGYTSFTRREAVGVIGQITPWNYPLMMAIWKFGPALAAGNTVVLKPAETTPVDDRAARRADRRRTSCRRACSTSSRAPASPPARR